MAENTNGHGPPSKRTDGVVRSLEAAYWRALRKNVRADNILSGARETVVDRLRRTYLETEHGTQMGNRAITNSTYPVTTQLIPLPTKEGPRVDEIVPTKAKARIPLPFYGLANQSFVTTEVVYTCVVGDRHFLQNPGEDAEHEHVLFADRDLPVVGWGQRPLLFWDANPKVITLFHKFILASVAPLGTKFIWVDSRIEISAEVTNALFASLEDHELCLFKHYERDCVYDEILAVLHARRSSTAQCEEYNKYLRDRAFPRRTGLNETGVMAFRVTPSTRDLFRNVFGLCYRYVPRDQLTLPYALAQSPVRVSLFNNGETHLRDTPGIVVRSWKEMNAT